MISNNKNIFIVNKAFWEGREVNSSHINSKESLVQEVKCQLTQMGNWKEKVRRYLNAQGIKSGRMLNIFWEKVEEVLLEVAEVERGRTSGLISLIRMGKIWITYIGKRLSFYYISHR